MAATYDCSTNFDWAETLASIGLRRHLGDSRIPSGLATDPIFSGSRPLKYYAKL